MKNICNFLIIVYIDYGKLMLFDCIIQICGGFFDCEMEVQVLDFMDFECECGIIIKVQSVILDYKVSDGEIYQLNFIDILGYVDFFYEVFCFFVVCEGVLLVVDVGQGVEVQILVNCYIVMEMDFEVVLVFNKIDLFVVDFECVVDEIEDIVGIDVYDVVCCLVKIGVGVIDVLECLVCDILLLEGDLDVLLQVLIIDFWFDNYFGVVLLVWIKNGIMCKGDKIKVMSIGQVYNVDCLGIFILKQVDCIELKCGEVGWLVCVIKDIFGVLVGDILIVVCNLVDKVLSGFKKVKLQVYVGLFLVSFDDYEVFCDVLGKLSFNDVFLFYELESFIVLGFGFCCGFFGLLYMEIIQECLECEYDFDLIIIVLMVVYEVEIIFKEVIYVDSLFKLLLLNNIQELCELIVECYMLLLQEFFGNVIILCVEKCGVQINMVYYGKQVVLIYEILMVEVVFDFFDCLKFIFCGYVLLDYNFKCFQVLNMVCVDVLINGECVDVLVLIIYNDNVLYCGCELVEKMKDLILCQQFDIVIQVVIGNYIIVCFMVKQLCKNVLVKCYGGDVSCKKKLLQKQKEGKKCMKQVGNVELLQEVFFVILYVGKDGK